MSCQTQPSNLSVDDMVQSATKIVKYTTPDELMKIMESEEIFNVVDVRQNNEYYHGFIPGSVNIPRGSIEFNIGAEAFGKPKAYTCPKKTRCWFFTVRKGSVRP